MTVKCPECSSPNVRFTGVSWPQYDEYWCQECDKGFKNPPDWKDKWPGG